MEGGSLKTGELSEDSSESAQAWRKDAQVKHHGLGSSGLRIQIDVMCNLPELAQGSLTNVSL